MLRVIRPNRGQLRLFVGLRRTLCIDTVYVHIVCVAHNVYNVYATYSLYFADGICTHATDSVPTCCPKFRQNAMVSRPKYWPRIRNLVLASSLDIWPRP